MKKHITTGIVAALLVVITLLSWHHIKTSRDAMVLRNLPGTWILDAGSFVIHPDLSYVGQFTNTTAGKLVTAEGSFQVRDSFLVNTMTKCSETVPHLPTITRSRIVQIGDSQMIVEDSDESGVTNVVLRKVKL